MKRLMLVSSFKEVAHLLWDFEKELKGKRVTFIPTASKVESVTFYVDSAKKTLESLGLIIDELDIAIATQEEIQFKLSQNEFIYITGGNSFYLLYELRRTGADQIIQKEVNAGKLYIGESAGAIVTAPDIEYIQGMDQREKAPNLSYFKGLGLVDFYMLPHYTNEPFKRVAKQIEDSYQLNLNLMPVSNHQAILISGNQLVIKSL